MGLSWWVWNLSGFFALDGVSTLFPFLCPPSSWHQRNPWKIRLLPNSAGLQGYKLSRQTLHEHIHSRWRWTASQEVSEASHLFVSHCAAGGQRTCRQCWCRSTGVWKGHTHRCWTKIQDLPEKATADLLYCWQWCNFKWETGLQTSEVPSNQDFCDRSQVLWDDLRTQELLG